MEDSAAKSVVHDLKVARVNSSSRAEVEGARRALDIFSWDMVVQKAATLCGLTVSEAMLAPIAPLFGSHAANLGHATLESLVSKPEGEDGLGLDWNDFQLKAKAFVYRAKFAMNDSSFEDILEQVDQASKLIGRLPGDATEFHGAKQKALNDNIIEMRREYTARIEESQSKTNELMRNLDKANTEVVDLKAATKTLQQDSAARIQQVTREMALRAEQVEQEAAQELLNERKRLEAEFHERTASERAAFEAKIETAIQSRQVAEQAVEAYKHRIEAGDLVDSAVLVELNTKLEAAKLAEEHIRTQILDLNDQLTQSQKRAELLKEENGIYQLNINELNQQISQLESQMRELVEQKSGTAEFAVLHERLEIRKQEVEKLRNELKAENIARRRAENGLAQVTGKFEQMKAQGTTMIQKLRLQVSELNNTNKLTMAQNGHLMVENGQIKTALGIIAFVGALVTASLMLVVMN